jgi:hypothetical protein
MGDSLKGAVRSDPPPEDLKRERDTFIQQFFRRGAQISEELLGDIEQLRERVQELSDENARLRTQLASDTAIRDLLKKIEDLEAEKKELMERAPRGRAPEQEFSRRFAELEEELANLGTLHVANLQLHSSRSVRRALKNLKELCAQFLGAAQVAVYWEADDSKLLVPLAYEGLTVKEARDFNIEDTTAYRAFSSSEIFSDVGIEAHEGTFTRPAAVIPLMISTQRVGAIVLFKSLEQKARFDSSDVEVFRLLSTQAAPAIVHAHLFAESGRRPPSVQALIDHED